MRTEHISKQYDLELDELDRKLREFGGIVEQEISTAIDAIRNAGFAIQVANEARTDAAATLRREIEHYAVLMIARRQPMAADLREIVGAFKICQHLDQVRHFAKAVARHARSVNKSRCPRLLLADFERLLEQVRNHHWATLDTYAARDANRSTITSVKAREILKASTAFVNRVVILMKYSPDKISVGAPLLMSIDDIAGICNQLDRVAETVYFVVEGQFPAGYWRVDDAPSIAL